MLSKTKILLSAFILSFALLLPGFVISVSAVEGSDCYSQPYNGSADTADCYTTCSSQDVLDRLPGCFSKGLQAPDASRIDDENMKRADLKDQVMIILNYALSFLGLLAVVAVVYAGVLMVGAFGTEKAEDGKKVIGWTAAGILVVLISYSFVNFLLMTGENVGTDPEKCYVLEEGSDKKLQIQCTDTLCGGYASNDYGNCSAAAGSYQTCTSSLYDTANSWCFAKGSALMCNKPGQTEKVLCKSECGDFGFNQATLTCNLGDTDHMCGFGIDGNEAIEYKVNCKSCSYNFIQDFSINPPQYKCMEKDDADEDKNCFVSDEANAEEVSCNKCKFGRYEKDKKYYCFASYRSQIGSPGCVLKEGDTPAACEKICEYGYHEVTKVCKPKNQAQCVQGVAKEDDDCTNCIDGYNPLLLVCNEVTDQRKCNSLSEGLVPCVNCTYGYNYETFQCKLPQALKCINIDGKTEISCNKCAKGSDVFGFCIGALNPEYCTAYGKNVRCAQCKFGFNNVKQCNFPEDVKCIDTNGKSKVSCNKCAKGSDVFGYCIGSQSPRYCTASGKNVRCAQCSYGFDAKYKCLQDKVDPMFSGPSGRPGQSGNNSLIRPLIPGQNNSARGYGPGGANGQNGQRGASGLYGPGGSGNGIIGPGGIVDDTFYDPSNNVFIPGAAPTLEDAVENALRQVGKLSPETNAILKKIQDLANGLPGATPITKEEKELLREALKAQGINDEMIKHILDKINKGEVLNEEELKTLKNSMQYGFMLQKFETELSILYDSMPKTATNIAAYNDVITFLSGVKMNPNDDNKIKQLIQAFSELKRTIALTPRVIPNVKASPVQGPGPLLVSFDGSDSLDPNNQTIPNSNFVWSYHDQDGNKQVIGNSPIIEHEFTEPGLYIVVLNVSTGVEQNGYKTAMDGVMKTKIKVDPKISQLNVKIDGKPITSLVKVHIDNASKGIMFDASESTIKLGRRIVEFKWNFGDGSEDYSLDGEALIHRYSNVGNYKVSLEAKDNTGEVTNKQFTIVVEHITANIEVLPLSGTTHTTFQFASSKSKSVDNVIQEFAWEIIDSTGKNVLNSNKQDISFQASRPGIYKVKLRVTDSSSEHASSVYNLKVSSLAPIANYTFAPISKSQPSVITFDASSSYDSDNDSISYSWDFDGDSVYDIQGSNTANVSYKFSKIGVYDVALKVTDSFGEENILSRIVRIDSILDVDFSVSELAVHKGKDIEFVSLSDRAKAWYWDFGDGGNSVSDAMTTHSFIRAGTYVVKLTVFDENDKENSVSKKVFVGDGESPIAAYELDVDGDNKFPEEGICGQDFGIVVNRRNTVRFSAEKSLNIDGSNHMLDYTWNFGDGNYGNTKVATHRFGELTEEGQCFQVSLAVKDRVTSKMSNTENFSIKVVNLPPILHSLTIDIPEGDVAAKVTPYEIRLRTQGAEDPDGIIKNYRWWYRKVDESNDVKRGLVQTQTPYAHLTLVSDGISGLTNEYVFVVEMLDNEGMKVTNEDILGASTSLHVKNGNNPAPIVDFSMDKNQVFVGDTISFFAQVSDAQGKELNNVSYEWDFNGDAIFDDVSTGMQVSRKFDSQGEYDVRLRVKHKGLSTSKKHTVFVDSITSFPLAAFTFQTKGKYFYGDASTSRYDESLPDVKLRYVWDFNILDDADGDGIPDNDNQSSSMTPEYVFSKDGIYYVKLTIVDNLANADSVERKVTIGQGNITGGGALTQGEFEKHSVIITAKNSPLTTLDLSLEKNVIKVGDSTKLRARVMNADGSSYNDQVDFEVVEGNVELAETSIKANGGLVELEIKSIEEGPVKIRVIAKNTFHETLEESIVLTVKESINESDRPELSKEEIEVRELRKEEAEEDKD